MADSASSILLLRLQSTGSNTNLWGGYLNTALSTIEQASKGYQTQALTGDTTISWTQYQTGNKGQCALLRTTGSLASAATVTLPAYMNFLIYWNNSGASNTVKCSGGTGVVVPNNRKALLYCDGTDYFFAGPNYIGDDITETNNRDIVDFAALTTAITAITTAQNGLVLVSATATESEYLVNALSADGAVTITKVNAGTAAEALQISVGAGGYVDAGRFDSGTTVSAGNSYTFVSGCTFYLEANPSDGAKARIALFNPNALYSINPNGKKVNNSTATLTGLTGGQTFEITYDDTSGDWA